MHSVLLKDDVTTGLYDAVASLMRNFQSPWILVRSSIAFTGIAVTVVRWLAVLYQSSYLQPYQTALTRGISRGMITIEWIFKEIKAYFTSFDFKGKIKVLESPVGSFYLAAMILNNARNFHCP